MPRIVSLEDARAEDRLALDHPTAENASEAWKRIVRTDDAWVPLILRVGLGAVMLPHGIQKLVPLGGAGGFEGTMAFFTDVMHIPSPLALLVIAIEVLGSAALVAGLLTRVAAAGIGAVMVGAALMVHAPNGFFMNWFGNQKGEGLEYAVLMIVMAASLVVTGGGKASMDRRILNRGE
jgi:putative oxidoreductase